MIIICTDVDLSSVLPCDVVLSDVEWPSILSLCDGRGFCLLDLSSVLPCEVVLSDVGSPSIALTDVDSSIRELAVTDD